MACRNCWSAFDLIPRRALGTPRSLVESRSTSSPRAQIAAARNVALARRHMSSQPDPAPGSDTNATSTSTSTKNDVAFLRKNLGQAQTTATSGKGGFLRKKIIEPLARKAVETAPSAVEPYIIYGATQRIYDKCAEQANYTMSEEDRKAGTLQTLEDGEEVGKGSGVWFEEFDLLPTFSTWSQVTMLHLYLVVARLRCLEHDVYKRWQSTLTDHFFNAAEERMETHHLLTSRSLRQRYLQDLFTQWRGLLLAYDEGVVRGDAALAAAVWRNLFQAREDIDPRKLAAVVGWMRACLAELEAMEDQSLGMHAADVFRKWTPDAHLRVVDRPVAELAQLFKELDVGEGGKIAEESN